MSTNFHRPLRPGTRIEAASINPPLQALHDAAVDKLSQFDPDNELTMTGRWNQTHLVLNGFHIYSSTNGHLYINNGRPTGDRQGNTLTK